MLARALRLSGASVSRLAGAQPRLRAFQASRLPPLSRSSTIKTVNLYSTKADSETTAQPEQGEPVQSLEEPKETCQPKEVEQVETIEQADLGEQVATAESVKQVEQAGSTEGVVSVESPEAIEIVETVEKSEQTDQIEQPEQTEQVLGDAHTNEASTGTTPAESTPTETKSDELTKKPLGPYVLGKFRKLATSTIPLDGIVAKSVPFKSNFIDKSVEGRVLIVEGLRLPTTSPDEVLIGDPELSPKDIKDRNSIAAFHRNLQDTYKELLTTKANSSAREEDKFDEESVGRPKVSLELEETVSQIHKLKPKRTRTLTHALEERKISKLLAKMTKQFRLEDLNEYIKRHREEFYTQEDNTEVLKYTLPLGTLLKTRWTAEPTSIRMGYTKADRCRYIIHHIWKVSLAEQYDTQGSINLELRDWMLEYLLNGEANNRLHSIAERQRVTVAVWKNVRTSPTGSYSLIQISGGESAAENTFDSIRATLRGCEKTWVILPPSSNRDAEIDRPLKMPSLKIATAYLRSYGNFTRILKACAVVAPALSGLDSAEARRTVKSARAVELVGERQNLAHAVRAFTASINFAVLASTSENAKDVNRTFVLSDPGKKEASFVPSGHTPEQLPFTFQPQSHQYFRRSFGVSMDPLMCLDQRSMETLGEQVSSHFRKSSPRRLPKTAFTETYATIGYVLSRTPKRSGDQIAGSSRVPEELANLSKSTLADAFSANVEGYANPLAHLETVFVPSSPGFIRMAQRLDIGHNAVPVCTRQIRAVYRPCPFSSSRPFSDRLASYLQVGAYSSALLAPPLELTIDVPVQLPASKAPPVTVKCPSTKLSLASVAFLKHENIANVQLPSLGHDARVVQRAYIPVEVEVDDSGALSPQVKLGGQEKRIAPLISALETVSVGGILAAPEEYLSRMIDIDGNAYQLDSCDLVESTLFPFIKPGWDELHTVGPDGKDRSLAVAFTRTSTLFKKSFSPAGGPSTPKISNMAKPGFSALGQEESAPIVSLFAKKFDPNEQKSAYFSTTQIAQLTVDQTAVIEPVEEVRLVGQGGRLTTEKLSDILSGVRDEEDAIIRETLAKALPIKNGPEPDKAEMGMFVEETVKFAAMADEAQQMLDLKQARF